MHDDLASLYAFNRWANGRVLGACRSLTAEKYGAEPLPGVVPVRGTVNHIAVVTLAWLRGLAGDTDPPLPAEDDLVSLDAAARVLDEAQGVFETLLPTLTPERLVTPQTLRRRNGQSASLPPWAVLRHIVNHATYHRGQVASKLKAFGVEQPATDLIFWVFEQQANRPG